MQLSLLTRTQVVGLMTATVQSTAAAGGFTINVVPGSIILAWINACAGIFLWLQWLVVCFIALTRLATCTGSDCDSFGLDFGFYRLAGTASSGPVTMTRFSVASAAIVPVGSVVKTGDYTQSFTVVADSTNAAWQTPNGTYPDGYFLIPPGTSSLTVTVVNSIVGAAGNIVTGAISLIAGVIPVDNVTNVAPFENGLNAESDAAFKLRFALWLIGLAKGTSQAVQSAVLGVAQNLTCAVLNCVATIGGEPAMGYFVVAIDDGSGATPSTTITAVYNAVQQVMPLGSAMQVVQATVVPASIALTITCPTPALKAVALPLVQTAIASYVAALPVANGSNIASLPYYKLAQLAFEASPNVTNVSGITLNGGTADIGGTPGTVVRLSSLVAS